MDEPDDILIYQNTYSDPDPETHNGLVFVLLHEVLPWEVCENCKGPVVVTHGRLEKGYIQIKECMQCDFEETDVNFAGCDECEGAWNE